MKNTHLKGLVHGALALGALVEALTTKSRARRLLSGAACGYHVHATMYHLMYEQEETHGTDQTQGWEEDYEEEYWDT